MTADLRTQLQSSLGSAYTLERELGGGGMSRVFVAQDTRLARKVVVKVLSPELAAALSMERFEREIRVAASLQQANIVPVLSAGEANGLPYFTMPFVQGESLDRLEQPDSTIAVYEHYVNTPEPNRWDIDSWELARILRRLGELYEAKGDREKAAAYYQRFVTEWKDADPELQPRVAEIRQRVARLSDPERR